MKIAVTSQNRKIITEHAGRCRKFWIFTVDDNQIIDKQLLELGKEQSFHESSVHEPHPLDDIDLLITAGMGSGMVRRLGRKRIKGLITKEEDPETAVTLYLKGELKAEEANSHDTHDHAHTH
ncbi:MAG: NifB/NifX family molybdenum-iron cluster-binding protein [Pseudomonas sp.]|jgi:predicted Fe-Mo cluster-binding NifX family protein|nr:NifB/NifX family molybdenum-iron cluster-binding protein [Pseudomonas sp.]